MSTQATCLRCNPRKITADNPIYDPVYDGIYVQGKCGSCGGAQGRRVVKRYKTSPIGGKRGRNSGKTKQSKSKH